MPEDNFVPIYTPQHTAHYAPSFGTSAPPAPGVATAPEDDDEVGDKPSRNIKTVRAPVSPLANVNTGAGTGGGGSPYGAQTTPGSPGQVERETDQYRRGSADLTAGNVAKAVGFGLGLASGTGPLTTAAAEGVEALTGRDTGLGVPDFEGFQGPTPEGTANVRGGRITAEGQFAADRASRFAPSPSMATRGGFGAAAGDGGGYGGSKSEGSEGGLGSLGGGGGSDNEGGPGPAGGGGKGDGQYARGGTVVHPPRANLAKVGLLGEVQPHERGGTVGPFGSSSRPPLPRAAQPMPPRDLGYPPPRVPGHSPSPMIKRYHTGGIVSQAEDGSQPPINDFKGPDLGISVAGGPPAAPPGGSGPAPQFGARMGPPPSPAGGPPAPSANPTGDPRYQAPGSVPDTAAQDDVPIMAEEGEFVITEAAAAHYSPEVLAILNDPELADDAAQILAEHFGVSFSGPAPQEMPEGNAVMPPSSGMGSMRPKSPLGRF